MCLGKHGAQVYLHVSLFMEMWPSLQLLYLSFKLVVVVWEFGGVVCLFLLDLNIYISFQLVDFEAMTTPSPDSFSKTAKSWMNLKRYKE